MKDCKDLKINSYLSPHPLDEDSDMDDEFVSWIPGFLDEPDEEQGLTAYLRDENIELYKNIEQSVSNVIRTAFESMWPLLDKHIFKSIQVAIELISFGPNSTALAGYSYSYSEPEKGIYVFHVDQNFCIDIQPI